MLDALLLIKLKAWHYGGLGGGEKRSRTRETTHGTQKETSNGLDTQQERFVE
jgi:hypothetical protein